jgi:hypothetical protein
MKHTLNWLKLFFLYTFDYQFIRIVFIYTSHKTCGPKFAVSLIHSDFLESIDTYNQDIMYCHIPTPWHNTVLKLKNGKYRVMRKDLLNNSKSLEYDQYNNPMHYIEEAVKSEKCDTVLEIPSVKSAYSAFPRYQRYVILFIVAFAGFIGPLSGNVYFPAIKNITDEFQLSDFIVNLSISLFMLIFAFAVSLN